MRPTVFFARADGIRLRLLYSLRLGWQNVFDQHYRKPLPVDWRKRLEFRPRDFPLKRDGGVGRAATTRKPILLLRFAA